MKKQLNHNKNPLADKSYLFALRIIGIYKKLISDKKEFILSRQLIRAGTAIGANISEANGAISNKDFSAKISLAYKESLETKYWLNLIKDSGYLESKEAEELLMEADELSKIMFSILRTTRMTNKS